MIELYFWTTPNGYKPLLFLEEAGIDYEISPVNISKGEQLEPEFLKISPNNRIPAIVDHNPDDGGSPLAQFESGAILQYLAEKTGKFIPENARGRAEVLQWLNWQMGGIGPMFGQYLHFVDYAPDDLPYAKNRYTREAERLLGVLDKRLKDREYVASEYSKLIWQSTLGFVAFSRRLKVSKMCGAGHQRSLNARRLSAPTKRAQRSIPFPPSHRTQRRYCLV